VFHLIQALNHNLCLKNEAFLSDTLIPIAANSTDQLRSAERTQVNRYRVAALPNSPGLIYKLKAKKN
jgi:hypothetical protein